MSLPHVLRAETGRHRLHALALSGEQQAGAVGLQRNYAILVPRGMRQAIEVSREAFLLGAWRHGLGAHDQKLSIDELKKHRFPRQRYSVYNTVVLAGY